MFKIAVLLAMLAVVMGTTGMPDDETEIETDRIKGTGVCFSFITFFDGI